MRLGAGRRSSGRLLRGGVCCASYDRAPRRRPTRARTDMATATTDLRDRPPRQARHARPPRTARSRRDARPRQGRGGRELARPARPADRLQDRLWAEAKHSVLVVLQGIDAAGKDGTINKVMDAFNPQGCPVTVVQGPDARGARPRLPVARPPAHVPRKGEIGIFNRSHYEDVLVVRVHGLVPRSGLVDALRPDQRLRADARRRGHDDRQVLPGDRSRRAARALPGSLRRPDEALEVLDGRPRGAQALGRLPGRVRRRPARRPRPTSAPWYVIPANRKWFRNLAVATILADTIADLRAAYPPVAEDVPPNLVID